MIRVWDPQKQDWIEEKVYGGGALRFSYRNRWVRALIGVRIIQRLLSYLLGVYESSAWSRRKIPHFVKQYDIPMEAFEEARYASFNEFFTRRFRAGVRPIVSEANVMAACAEGRYFGFKSVTGSFKMPVKGYQLGLQALIKHPEWFRVFEGGPVLLARLAPVDYHRFHFPLSGKMLGFFKVPGLLHSVSPYALGEIPEILVMNERHVSVFEAPGWGRLAMIEVGAMGVGRILQTHALAAFERGQEKGMFLFGASTVIVVGEPGAWQPTPGLLDKTQEGFETFIRLGEPVAVK